MNERELRVKLDNTLEYVIDKLNLFFPELKHLVCSNLFPEKNYGYISIYWKVENDQIRYNNLKQIFGDLNSPYPIEIKLFPNELNFNEVVDILKDGGAARFSGAWSEEMALSLNNWAKNYFCMRRWSNEWDYSNENVEPTIDWFDNKYYWVPVDMNISPYIMYEKWVLLNNKYKNVNNNINLFKKIMMSILNR